MVSLFAPPKSKRLVRIVSIKSPTAFQKSVSTLKKGGLSSEEKSALVLARNRAAAQLNRKNLSLKERKQFEAISKTRI